MTVHNFQQSLERSQKASDEPFWDAVYRRAFPNIVDHMVCKGNRTQRDGVDRLVFLDNGREYRIDEKKRDREYSDILLEYLSNDRTGAPGWVEKDLSIDYLAYAFMQSQRCYLYSWPMLRRAWLHHREPWMRSAEQEKYGFRIVPAENKGYTTWSIVVPIKTLEAAVTRASIISIDLTKTI